MCFLIFGVKYTIVLFKHINLLNKAKIILNQIKFNLFVYLLNFNYLI